MHQPDFEQLRQRLVREGFSARDARRTSREIADHFADLTQAFRAQGMDDEQALRQAANELGDLDILADRFGTIDTLKGWAYHHPVLAGAVSLPARSLSHIRPDAGTAEAFGRWFVGAAISLLVTSSMLLVLQITIDLA